MQVIKETVEPYPMIAARLSLPSRRQMPKSKTAKKFLKKNRRDHRRYRSKNRKRMLVEDIQDIIEQKIMAEGNSFLPKLTLYIDTAVN